MKNIILIIIVVFVTASCSNFLEEEAISTYTTENFPTNEQEAEALLNQVYSDTREAYADRWLFLATLPSEMVTTRRDGSDRRARLDNWEIDNTVDYIEDYWEDTYVSIGQANAVINFFETGELQIDEAVAQRLTAEAKVLRANAYFNIVTFYGEAPLNLNPITTLEGTETPVSSIADIYDAVIQDLLDAEPNLPHEYTGDANKGRMTRGAARAMLGKVYLQKGADPAGIGSPQDFVEAEKWLRMVVNADDGGKNYILEDEFENLFGLQNLESAKNSDEIIMQLWIDADDCCDLRFHAHMVNRDSDFGGGQWGNFAAEVPFYLSYEDEDDRLQVTFLDSIYVERETDEGVVIDTFIYNPDNPLGDGYQHDGPTFQKYVDINSPDNSTSANVFLIRYADVLLSLAESINRQDGPTAEAIGFVNQVRNRADLVDLEPVPTTQADFNEAIFNERRWELAFEGHGLRDGHRFFDIFEQRVEASPNYELPPLVGDADKQRVFDAVPEVPIDVTMENIRFPIPQREIDTNPAISSGQ